MFLPKSRRLARSSTVRLSLALMMLVSAVFLLLGALLYWGTIQLMERDIYLRLERELVSARELYARSGAGAVTGYIENVDVELNRFEERFFLIVDRDCAIQVATDVDLPPTLCTDTVNAGGWHHFEWNKDEGYVRAARLPDGRRFLAGVFAVEVESARYLMGRISSWGLILAIGLSLGASIAMASIVERRLEPMNRISKQVRLGNLAARLRRRGTGDEFDTLAGNLNAMLDEIQALMDGIRRVSDAIAHELRTPLTVLRGRLEDLQEALRGEVHAAQAEEALREVDRLLSTFGSLLRIAQIEAGSRRSGFVDFDLRELLLEVVDFYEPVAGEKGIELRVGTLPACVVLGDRDLLFQAIANVVENALRCSSENNPVSLALEALPGQARIIVADSGPGIPEAERDSVLERFYRLARDAGSGGAGLGLSLVAAVMKLHAGRIVFEDNDPGLRAVLELPLK